jgi:sec-independent protein translocase protein TatA
MLYPIALGMPGGAEWIVIAAIGLLLFGKRLPEVGRSLGKGIVEFKKGLKGVEEEMEAASDAKPAQPVQAAQPQLTGTPTVTQPALGHKFDPYTGKPIENATTTTTSQT